jgi:hypothetical protein
MVMVVLEKLMILELVQMFITLEAVAVVLLVAQQLVQVVMVAVVLAVLLELEPLGQMVLVVAVVQEMWVMVLAVAEAVLEGLELLLVMFLFLEIILL